MSYIIHWRTKEGAWEQSEPINAEIQAIKAAQALMVRPKDPATAAVVRGPTGIVYRTKAEDW